MFKSSIVLPEFKTILGWDQHHDTGEINIPAALQISDTGEFYQQKQPVLSLDNIQATIPENYALDSYLEKVEEQSINEMLNDFLQYRQVHNYGKTLLDSAILLNKYGHKSDKIVNQSRFVGLQIRVHSMSGLQMLINTIGFQSELPENFTLYLFHTSKEDPVATANIASTGQYSWSWSKQSIELDGMKWEEHEGGVFVIGYYQEDLTGSAINYSSLDWSTGICGSCNDPHRRTWQSIAKHFQVYPLYVPFGSYTDLKMFDLRDAIYTKNESFGLNLKFTVRCDLSDFFIQNKLFFKNLLSIKVTWKILEMMDSSNEINGVEENLKHKIIRLLEGDKELKSMNIPTQYHREMKAVQFNMSGINSACLPTKESGYVPVISQV